HAERGGQRGSGVACTVAIVFALGSEHEAVEAFRLSNSSKALAASGKDLVNVGLVADVEDKFVGGRVEDRMESEGKFDDSEIGTEMAASFGESLNQEDTNLFRQLG